MKKTVLVVDDDDGVRFVLTRTLEGLGHDVITAEDGADVPDLLQQRRFDLLVLDLYMPGMNGFEVLRQLRRPRPGFLPLPATGSDVLVLVVSGETRPESVANARAAGADAFLGKPVGVPEFEAAVIQLLSGHRPRRRASRQSAL